MGKIIPSSVHGKPIVVVKLFVHHEDLRGEVRAVLTPVPSNIHTAAFGLSLLENPLPFLTFAYLAIMCTVHSNNVSMFV